MRRPYLIILLAFVIVCFAFGCSRKKVINRDYIPILKASLYKLQLAVKDKNFAQIDSLLSVRIIEKKQSSDSLVHFIFGDDTNYQFVQFGNAEIVYTNEKARIDCYVMDSTGSHDRHIVLFLEYEHDLWLFTSFEAKTQTDSLQLD